jgi:hypothetical protein
MVFSESGGWRGGGDPEEGGEEDDGGVNAGGGEGEGEEKGDEKGKSEEFVDAVSFVVFDCGTSSSEGDRKAASLDLRMIAKLLTRGRRNRGEANNKDWKHCTSINSGLRW